MRVVVVDDDDVDGDDGDDDDDDDDVVFLNAAQSRWGRGVPSPVIARGRAEGRMGGNTAKLPHRRVTPRLEGSRGAEEQESSWC